MSTASTPPTVEDQATARLVELGVRVEQLRESGQWQAMLRVARQFHHYSLTNQILIWFQNPAASRVAGYRKWQELGRQVRKGERAIKILAPIKRNVRDGDDDVKEKIVAFRQASVFDVAQTDGDPLPTVEWPDAGECPEGIFDDLVIQVCGVEGLDIVLQNEPDPVRPTARGWYEPDEQRITLVDQGNEGSHTRTLLHELGHHFDPDLRSTTSRAEKELVAESAAWLAAGQIGVGLDDQTEHYLASWGGDSAELVKIAKRASLAAGRIVGLMATELEVQADVG